MSLPIEHEAVKQAIFSLEVARMQMREGDLEVAEKNILDVLDQLTGFCSEKWRLYGPSN